MKIVAIMPLYKFMEAPCVMALFGMISDIFRRGDSFRIIFTQGINICLARNQTLEYSVSLMEKEKIDYIVTLDHDHEYSAKAFYTLIDKIKKYDLPDISAAYYMRGNRDFSMSKGEKNVTEATLGSGVQKCDFFGFGFCVFKAETMKKVFKETRTPFRMDVDRYTSEDVHFCRIMKKIGIQPYYDADTIVGHYAGFFNK